MPALAQRVLDYIRRKHLVRAGYRLGVAVSGGADSVALLRIFLELRRELGIVLSVVHFNHQLRGDESDQDEQFVAALAREHNLEFHAEHGDVRRCSADQHLSLEAAARKLRYEFFHGLLCGRTLNRIATAHTLDDQAETVVLRLVRGAGTRGLAGIYPQVTVPDSSRSGSANRGGSHAADPASVIRPLLEVRRPELEAYLHQMNQPWREDASNADLHHARNRVRHEILPRLERDLNPSVRENLAEVAEIARVEEDYWLAQVAAVLPSAWSAQSRTLSLHAFLELPLALRRRLLRAAAESLGLRLEFHHVEEILDLAGLDAASASVSLAGGWEAASTRAGIVFSSGNKHPADNRDYQYALSIPGRIDVPEAGLCLEAVVIAGDYAGYNPEHLFDPALVGKELLVRNWRAGDRFWPAHSKAPKKVKELLQERHITGEVRRLWPVAAAGGEVIWLCGFRAGERMRFRSKSGPAVCIREMGQAVSK